VFENVLAEVRVPLVIPFAVGALIVLWALVSGAIAFTGSQRSGHHEVAGRIAPPPEQGVGGTMERANFHIRIGRVLNFVLAFAVLGATVLMIVGMIVAAPEVGHPTP
jgi:hypothetical protein